MEFDLAITKGTILDGSGQPRFQADLGVRNGRIEAIARAGSLTAQRTFDAEGLAVAPGFIDIHSHADWILTLPDHDQILAPMVAQGITTVVGGNCGHSPAPVTDASVPIMERSSEVLRDGSFPYRWRSMGEFLGTLEKDGLLMNAAFLVGHGAIRYAAMGERPVAPTEAELSAMRGLVRRSMNEGAFGLSAGLAYDPG